MSEETILNSPTDDTLQLAITAALTLDDIKGEEINVLKLSEASSFADFFVIASGNSTVHMQALANHVRKAMADAGEKIGHSEGRESTSWILLDYGPLLVHVFSRPARQYYEIEELWGDSLIVNWQKATNDS